MYRFLTLITYFLLSQANVPPVQSEVHWSGQKGQIYSLDGHCCGRRLQI